MTVLCAGDPREVRSTRDFSATRPGAHNPRAGKSRVAPVEMTEWGEGARIPVEITIQRRFVKR